ncbi:MAG: DUF2332 domain-containing protein [Cyanobacteria bacterium NC_groundwater_1444_Ag_S-0.65um_54_12]|nr:DUF2332 domain-containing protein [Cyanobacteria bacterium NC_groundwater_1444_Ag_S-0.65um_54_12]
MPAATKSHWLSTGQLERAFQGFSRSCTGTSPLYERLAAAIVSSPDLLALASKAKIPVPNIFLAAVHWLLLKTPHPFGRFYASISECVDTGDPFPEFQAFCLDNATEIERIISSRLCQTSEVQRCANLLPAFHVVTQASSSPVHFVDIGASAGLNLLWQHYAYDYGQPTLIGDKKSGLVLQCELLGKHSPNFLPEALDVASVIGFDLNPLDVSNEDDMLWMRALIWPEHQERANRLAAAVKIGREHKPTVVAGNAIDLLPGHLASIPQDETVCVFHSYTMNQISDSDRARLSDILAGAAIRLTIYEVALEWLTDAGPMLDLSTPELGNRRSWSLARCEQHGNWLEWLAPRSIASEVAAW